ncbi:MAG: histone deacetylase, partial [bacterium]|nr:histone deacetylase [bacterium]
FFDPDTPNIPEIYKYACLSAGGALAAAQSAIEKKEAFALIRPPGHHAGKNFLGGFCYFNNIAIAVSHCLKSVKKVAILDLDGHHGNGTESIFKDSKQVIFISIHQVHSYPWTGIMSFSNCFNFPVKKGTTFSDYKIFLFESMAIINRFSPDIVGISLGFDTHKNDPLLDLNFIDSDYYHMAKMIAKGISAPAFFVLEGGYDINTIGNSFFCFISGWEKIR